MSPSIRPLALAAVLLAACDKGAPEPARDPAAGVKKPAAAQAAAAPKDAAITPPARRPAPARIVAIGDLHGDLAATRAVLKLAGAIDDKDAWIGKDLMVVQTGDEIDRGDDDRRIIDLFDRLAGEAKAAGGAVVALNGNHEVMNVQLDFRYVTEGAYREFSGVPGAITTDPRIERLPEAQRPRAGVFLPGGPYAKKLAQRDLVAVIGDTVFLHGGLLPKHLRYGVDRMNREVRAWMDGSAREVPAIVTSEDGPIWLRRYSAAADAEDCKVLKETLALIPAKRMVVGHTVQRGGINSACDEAVWRIDVGLSKFYGGKPEVLEIKGDQVKALR